jgi:predicted NACHT family NTPase
MVENKMKSDRLLQIPPAYCQWIKDTYAKPATGTAAGPFIPLQTTVLSHETKPRTMAVETLAARQQSMLLWGDAGMGKTTLVKHLAYSIVTGSCAEELSGHLPVIVFLNKLWQTFYREKVKNARVGNAAADFQRVLSGYFRETGCPLGMETVAGFLSQGRVLFLLDGLDEIPPQLYGELMEQLPVSFRKQREPVCADRSSRRYRRQGAGEDRRFSPGHRVPGK